MGEFFLGLNRKDREDALGVVSAQSGRPPHLLEKDVWVVWALRTIFNAPFGEHVVFKGGTSLSKAYGAIKRFSEDVDLTYDIRSIAPDLLGDQNSEALPPSKSQEKKWSKEIRERLSRWVGEAVRPLVQNALIAERLPATARVDPEDGHVLQIEYEHTAEGSGYVKPVVVLEFGARSTGEPCAPMPVYCDAAAYLPTLDFPTSTPRVMNVERTFWEKATAIHVFCAGGKLRGNRFSRHWYDLAQLDRAGHATSAFGRVEVARQVARHKSWFFAEKTSTGENIDYARAVAGHLLLIPSKKELLAELAEDYERMIADGLLLETAIPFRTLMTQCRDIESRANVSMRQGPSGG